ncbi:helix-turn-helix domain-containing protein [Streptosporangium sp. NPDC051023]|uniref:TetR/AcrR family transcriptional regulator n=1 Tax=Streptosporangium sp. NPDC051023 TaxID=3155410 RepID=UPI00344CC242
MPEQSSRIAPSAETELRADALRNRQRILHAAREAFATRGIEVPMAAIARRAGVGMATLYRRFPSRESLVTEVFADQFAACGAVVDVALADPDPWRAFRTVVEKVCAMQVADRGFTAAFLTAFPEAVDYEEGRARAERGLDTIVRRAKAAGSLRADFDLADLVLLFKANHGVIADTGDDAADASRRLVAYLLQSFHTTSPTASPTASAEPLPPPPKLGLASLLTR